MRIEVTPGDVQIASVEVCRHTGGIYTVLISTPQNRRVGIGQGRLSENGDKRSYQVLLYPEGPVEWRPPTCVNLTPTSNDEEEAFLEGLFDVLDDWSRYSVTLIAIPASVLDESEEAGTWVQQGPIDYLATNWSSLS